MGLNHTPIQSLLYTANLNLKVGAPFRRLIFGSCLSTFFALKVQLVVSVSTFMVVSFLICYSSAHDAPRAIKSFVKVGDVPPVPYGIGNTVSGRPRLRMAVRRGRRLSLRPMGYSPALSVTHSAAAAAVAAFCAI